MHCNMVFKLDTQLRSVGLEVEQKMPRDLVMVAVVRMLHLTETRKCVGKSKDKSKSGQFGGRVMTVVKAREKASPRVDQVIREMGGPWKMMGSGKKSHEVESWHDTNGWQNEELHWNWNWILAVSRHT